MGFCRIMAEPDGAAIYGIWHCIVGACSQQKKRNGWLTEDGDCKGSAWGVDDLSLKFRRPVAEIQRALEFLTSPKVGWLVIHENTNKTKDLTTYHHAVTMQSPSSPSNERTNEEKEEKEGRERTKLGAQLKILPAAERSIRLMSLCKELFGIEEMSKQNLRWYDRTIKNPDLLERVLGEVKGMKLEGKIKTTPARTAEDLLKRFA